MPIDARRPFTEMVEVAQNELVREAASNVEGKYRGFINQVYLNDFPSLLPEKYIRKRGYITAKADYTTGTVTVGTGTSNMVGASTSWTSANSDGLIITVDGADEAYRMTFEAGTSLTFQNSLAWVGSSGSGLGYRLVQNRYALASDFSYLSADSVDKPNVVSFMLNGVELFLSPLGNEEYDRNYSPKIVSDAFYGYTVKYESSNIYLYVTPNPDSALNFGYWYIPELTAMVEYTTGTVTLTTGTAVTGSGTLWLSALNTANTYYLRNDADGTGSASLWFKMSTIGTNTAITLSSSFTGTSGTGIAYTIAEISKWPARFDDAMLYRTAYLGDPDNTQSTKWNAEYQRAVALDLTVESKRKRGHTLKYFPGKR